MDGKIDQLFLPKHLKNYSAVSGIDPNERIITGLSAINFYVGPNNSGKSRLLRKIATNEDRLFRFSNFPKSLDLLKAEILNELDKQNLKSYFDEIKDPWWNLEYNIKSSDPQRQAAQLRGIMDRLGNQTSHELRTIFRKVDQEFSAYIQSESTKRSMDLNIHRIYIPTLRGLRPLPDQGHTKKKISTQ